MSERITLSERLHNLAEIWGFTPRPPRVETVKGEHWRYVDGIGNNPDWIEIEPGVWEKEDK